MSFDKFFIRWLACSYFGYSLIIFEISVLTLILRKYELENPCQNSLFSVRVSNLEKCACSM